MWYRMRVRAELRSIPLRRPPLSGGSLLFEAQQRQELSAAVAAEHRPLDGLVVGAELPELNVDGVGEDVFHHLRLRKQFRDGDGVAHG